MATRVLRWNMNFSGSGRLQRRVPFHAFSATNEFRLSQCACVEVRSPKILKIRPPAKTENWGIAEYHGSARNCERYGPRATVSFDWGLLSGPW